MIRYFVCLFCVVLFSYSNVTYSAATLEQGLLAYQQGDLSLAQGIFEPLAEAGDTKAQFYLSVVHRRRFPPQTERSLFWLKKAAASDYLPAQFNLGSYYHKTKPVSSDLKQSALYWWKRAAQGGYDRAQFNLAKLYAVGDNVPQNLDKARYWYQKAADQGMQRASDALEILQEESLKATLENQTIDPVEHEISTVFLPPDPASESVALVDKQTQTPVQPAQNIENKNRVDAGNLALDAPKPANRKNLIKPLPEATVKKTQAPPTQSHVHNRKSRGEIPLIELDWAQQQIQTHYTIQLSVFNAVQKCQNQAFKLLHKHQLKTHIVSRLKQGEQLCYVLHGSFAHKKQAQRRAAKLSKSIKYWVRPLSSLPPLTVAQNNDASQQGTQNNIKPDSAKKTTWLMQQAATNYTVQFYVLNQLKKCKRQARRLLKKYQLRTQIIPTTQNKYGACYVVHGSFPRKALAKKRVANLPKSVKYWIRPLHGLQILQSENQ